MKIRFILLLSGILISVHGALHPDPVRLPSGFGQKKEFTISCWVKFDSSMTNQTNYGILYKGTRSGFPEMQFQICIRRDRPEFKYISKDGRWCGIMMNGSDWVGIGKRIPIKKLPALRPDHWTMLTATYAENGVITLYVDGKIFFRTEKNPPPPLNDHPVLFGRSEWGNGLKCWYFPGLISKFTALEKCLSQIELAELEKKQRSELDARMTIPGAEIPVTDFSVKLKRTSAYEKKLPASLPGKPNIHAEIVKHNDVPEIFVNGRIIPAAAMMPSPYVAPAKTQDSVRDFAAAGIRLYSTILWSQGNRNDWWLGEGKYDFSAVDKRLGILLKAAPQGYIFPRIKLDPPEWWIAKNKSEMEYGNTVSPSSGKWRALYRQMLKDLVAHIENSPYAGRIVAYQFGAFIGSEWLIYRKLSSPPSKRAFEKFKRGKKTNRKNNPYDPEPVDDISLESAFLSHEIADIILDAASVIKQVTNGKKLTGIFYGYGSASHLDYARIIASPLIDFFCSPTSYAMRNAGDAGQFTSQYWASLRLHNKMYFDEADIRTHYYKIRVDYRCANLFETCNVIKRAVGYSLTRGTSLWWFLLVGNETFHDEAVMSVIADGAKENVVKLKQRKPLCSPNAEVAVFVSPRNQARTYFNDLFSKLYLDTLPRSGAPFDVYPIEDATHPDLPEYKMYIFLNPPGDMKKFRRNGFKLWVFQNKHSLIGTQEHRAAVPVVGRFIQNGRKPGINLKLSHYYTVNDPNAQVLGLFDGKTASAVKGNDAWFLSVPDIRSLHILFKQAGVHVWNRSGDVISAGNGYVMLHAVEAGEKQIFLPAEYGVKEIFHADTEKNMGSGRSIRSYFKKGETKVFRLITGAKENFYETSK